MPNDRAIMNASLIHRHAPQVQDMIHGMVESIVAFHQGEARLALVGIQQKGVLLAEAIRRRLEEVAPEMAVHFGELDVGLYRDDLAINPAPEMKPTIIPENLQDVGVVIVDDVIQSGRTIRAALDAILDFGYSPWFQDKMTLKLTERPPIRAINVLFDGHAPIS